MITWDDNFQLAKDTDFSNYDSLRTRVKKSKRNYFYTKILNDTKLLTRFHKAPKHNKKVRYGTGALNHQVQSIPYEVTK